jgi:hypothetical protein
VREHPADVDLARLAEPHDVAEAELLDDRAAALALGPVVREEPADRCRDAELGVGVGVEGFPPDVLLTAEHHAEPIVLHEREVAQQPGDGGQLARHVRAAGLLVGESGALPDDRLAEEVEEGGELGASVGDHRGFGALRSVGHGEQSHPSPPRDRSSSITSLPPCLDVRHGVQKETVGSSGAETS